MSSLSNNMDNQCDICNKTFASNSVLLRHSLIHAGVLPFTCPICMESFRRSETLQVHLRTHERKFTYLCSKCSFICEYKCELVCHTEEFHREDACKYESSGNIKVAAQLNYNIDTVTEIAADHIYNPQDCSLNLNSNIKIEQRHKKIEHGDFQPSKCHLELRENINDIEKNVSLDINILVLEEANVNLEENIYDFDENDFKIKERVLLLEENIFTGDCNVESYLTYNPDCNIGNTIQEIRKHSKSHIHHKIIEVFACAYCAEILNAAFIFSSRQGLKLFMMSTSVEERLAAFRAMKIKEKNIQEVKSRFIEIWNYFIYILSLPFRYVMPQRLQDTDIHPDKGDSSECEDQPSTVEGVELVDDEMEDSPSLTILDWMVMTLKILLWLILWQICIHAEVGAIFFLLSGFFFIWYNTRTKPSKSGTPSAYSVFNEDFKTITGTFTAEQFERTLLNRKNS